MRLRPYSTTALALGGAILMALGLYFAFIRPPLLPEDPRFMGTTLAQILATTPGLLVWLRRVFWVMGGYMFAAGLLTVYVAVTSLRSRDRGAAVVTGLAGLASIGLMAAVNFMIDSVAPHWPERRECGLGAARPLHVGWRNLHPDASLNFQLNRWLAYGGESWLADVQPVLEVLTGYDAWRAAFLTLGERALNGGRPLDAALHLRAAEFFMVPGDRRKAQVRRQLTALLRHAYGVKPADRRDVPFEDGTLPAFCFAADKPRGTIVAFGGFDSYIEEFFPIFVQLRDRGWTVVAFEGPGQGEVLEDGRRSMTPEWHKPVRAVLDAYGLDEVTLLGISLGGCLAIRTAAFELRVKRVIAFDAMTDFLACMLRQLPPAGAHAMRWLMRVRARWVINGIARAVARRRPVIDWGLTQAMHVLGCPTPFDVFGAAAAFRTGDISERVEQDVLLLAGAADHYVPLQQMWDQAALLTAARSVTCRVFSSADDAQAHCQVGNLPMAIGVMVDWLGMQRSLTAAPAPSASKPDTAYKQEASRLSVVEHSVRQGTDRRAKRAVRTTGTAPSYSHTKEIVNASLAETLCRHLPRNSRKEKFMNDKMKSPSLRRSMMTACFGAALLTGLAGPSMAATDPPVKTVDIKAVDIHAWRLNPATGWSVKKLIGKKVKGPKGENVGEVDNIVFGPDGKVRELIVSTGGFLGFGDKNLAVKWSDVTAGPGYDYVNTPITAESVKKYGLFDGFPKSSGALAARDWRSSELIGDYVYLKGNVHYAYVRDLIVSEGGELQAVIVSPDVGFAHGGGGYYAYPFFGYPHGWNPGNAHYNLPYGTADIAELLPYAYRK